MKVLAIIVVLMVGSLSAKEPLHIFYVEAYPFTMAAGSQQAIVIRVRARDRIDALLVATHSTVWTDDEWRAAKVGFDEMSFKVKIVDDASVGRRQP